MPRKFELLLADVLQYGGAAAELVRGKSYLAYANDEKLRLAVERCLMVVGEALQQAFKQSPNLVLYVSDLEDVIAMRHRLVHGYYSIEDAICWSAAMDELPGLLEEIEMIAARRPVGLQEEEWHE